MFQTVFCVMDRSRFKKKTRSSVASPAKRGIFGLARNEDAGSSHGEARYIRCLMAAGCP